MTTQLTALELKQIPSESRDLAAELQRRLQGEVRFDGYTRMLYSTDASLYQIKPVGVVVPKSVEDIQAAVEIAVRHGIPILPRGSGSSLAGQAVGAALIIDTSKYMDKLVAVDVAARTVTAQPGITVSGVNRALAKHKLMIGPDPASAERASIGGSVGNNATGSHSILYGMMADNVVNVATILADGSLANFGPVEPSALAAKGRADTLEGRIYRELPATVQALLPEIITRWPKHWRRASGYNLDRLAAALLPVEERGQLSLPSRFRPAVCDPRRIDHFNIAQLITGSEGTLAVVTEATLNLFPVPARTALAVLSFANIIDSCAAVPDILATEPSAAELMDKQMLDLARLQPEWAKKLHFIHGDPGAVLVVEYYGESASELTSKLDRLDQHLRAGGYDLGVVRVLEPARQAEVWAVRKAGLNILGSRRGDLKPVPGIEDVSVPPEQLADYMSKMLDFCTQEQGIGEVAVYAHASAGCLHVRPLLNMKNTRDVQLLQILGDYAAELCVQYSGAMSGEHGDGLARSSLNPRLFGPTLYGGLQAVKQLFDPQRLLNPGKIVDAPPLTENLRMGPSYQTITLDTVFDWGNDGGYAPAIEMCNGAAVCRKLGAGSMCPSYMATRDKRDTTRGRANALRNALAGNLPPAELFSEQMYGVMDLCLGCKACKSECPSAVDMAKIKGEYLVHYYRHNGLPLFNRLMGLLPTLSAWMYRLTPFAVPLVNWGLSSGLGKALMARIGVHPARTLPPFNTTTLARWHQERQEMQQPPPPSLPLRRGGTASSAATDRPAVMLFHDTWSNYNDVEVGMAAVRVLEAAGYDVQLAHGRQCCGRPLITGGQADKAKAWVDHNVALLAPTAAQGIPIVGIEPSCILTLRDEYLNLASDTKRAKLLAANAFTFEEFVVREAAVGRFQGIWRAQPGQALLHGHCHHKALVGSESSLQVLRLAGYSAQEIPSGCCGMAGDFGYEQSHYEISRTIGEDRLFPAVRAAAAETVLVASGTSCRHQIEHFTERHAVHLVEALAAALAS